jgi:predicted metal-dependent hydrolase
MAELEKIVDDRRYWIYTKLIQKESFKPPADTKEYVPGEGFYYLGRSYRLTLVNRKLGQPPLRLYRSRFELLRSQQNRGQELFIQWYRRHLQPHLESTIKALVNRVGASPRSLQVRELGYRWASCGHQGDLYFHWRVAMLPRAMIEYVVVHEMVHLIEPRHTSSFWERVERILPDFSARKRWLAENGASYDL